jgi:predicted nucleotidyltransferase component of viral defense system
MIPQSAIIEWSNYVPWQTNEQVEQDLIICRALVEIFKDNFLSEKLAFRGGTALHKLYLHPQPRYSEDIDLVQISEGGFGEIIDRLRKNLEFLGVLVVKTKAHNNTLIFKFESEFPPVQILKLKVETNCREHFTELGFIKKRFEVQSSWFNDSCQITTYKLEELLGTKMRALYQRRKGRDLFDLYKAITESEILSKDEVLRCYKKYMTFSVGHLPTQKQFLMNMDLKMKDPEFIGDISALLRPEIEYDYLKAYEYIKAELLEKL